MIEYHTKYKIGEKLAKFFLRYQHGNSLSNIVFDLFRLYAYSGMLSIYARDFLSFEISPKILIVFAPLFVFGLYIIGYLNEKVGFWRYLNRYTTKELNPHLAEMGDKITEIHCKICQKENK